MLRVELTVRLFHNQMNHFSSSITLNNDYFMCTKRYDVERMSEKSSPLVALIVKSAEILHVFNHSVIQSSTWGTKNEIFVNYFFVSKVISNLSHVCQHIQAANTFYFTIAYIFLHNSLESFEYSLFCSRELWDRSSMFKTRQSLCRRSRRWQRRKTLSHILQFLGSKSFLRNQNCSTTVYANFGKDRERDNMVKVKSKVRVFNLP